MKYCLIFIIHKNSVLLLNRSTSPAMGLWTGVGGQQKESESCFECAIREAMEETGIDLTNTIIEDYVDLEIDSIVYHAVIQSKTATPHSFEEGVLMWKPITWALDTKNKGMCKYAVKALLHITRKLYRNSLGKM